MLCCLLHCRRYRTVVNHINGGVMLLRPCAAAEAHMVSLLDAHPKLRFVHGAAEQDFFGWYYRYTGATLPLQWNCQAEQCLDGSRTGEPRWGVGERCMGQALAACVCRHCLDDYCSTVLFSH